MGAKSTSRWLFAVLALSLALVEDAPALSAADSEDELKAATVWLFIQYSQLTPGTDGAITVGVLGRPSFEPVLRHTLEGKSTGGHPIRVVDAKLDLRCCQVVYLAIDNDAEIRRALQGIQPPLRVLAIGESDHFLEQGGAVSLSITEGHMSFETSLEALDRCNVTISSNLLKFGRIRKRGQK